MNIPIVPPGIVKDDITSFSWTTIGKGVVETEGVTTVFPPGVPVLLIEGRFDGKIDGTVEFGRSVGLGTSENTNGRPDGSGEGIFEFETDGVMEADGEPLGVLEAEMDLDAVTEVEGVIKGEEELEDDGVGVPERLAVSVVDAVSLTGGVTDEVGELMRVPVVVGEGVTEIQLTVRSPLKPGYTTPPELEEKFIFNIGMVSWVPATEYDAVVEPLYDEPDV